MQYSVAAHFPGPGACEFFGGCVDMGVQTTSAPTVESLGSGLVCVIAGTGAEVPGSAKLVFGSCSFQVLGCVGCVVKPCARA